MHAQPVYPHPLSPTTTNLFSIADIFVISRVSCKLSSKRLAFFTQCNALEVIQVIVHINSLFIFLTEWYSSVWMYHMFNRSPIKGYLGSFQFLAVMSKAAVNIYMQVSV